MAIITIRTPPDGDDLTQGAAQRFQALLPQGVGPKEAILRLMRIFVRQRELQLLARDEEAQKTANIQAKAAALDADPDLGPPQPL